MHDRHKGLLVSQLGSGGAAFLAASSYESERPFRARFYVIRRIPPIFRCPPEAMVNAMLNTYDLDCTIPNPTGRPKAMPNPVARNRIDPILTHLPTVTVPH
jgi:hypothetical protein